MKQREIEMRHCAEWHAMATTHATVIPAQAGIQASRYWLGINAASNDIAGALPILEANGGAL